MSRLRSTKLILVFFTSLLTLSLTACLSRPLSLYNYKNIMAKKNRNAGVVNAMKLRKNTKPVKHIEVGKTYIVLYPQYSENVWTYIKLTDNSHYLCLEDGAHRPRSYYIHDEYDDKVMHLLEGTYRREGNNYMGIATTRMTILAFDYKKNVKPGVHGVYDNGIGVSHEMVNNLVKKSGRYFFTRNNKSDEKLKLYLAKEQLPNSIDEYMKEYKLSEEFPEDD